MPETRFESAKINIRYPHWAVMTKEDTAKSPPEYDIPFIISQATTLTRTPTVQNTPAYGDGIVVEAASGSSGGSISLGIHALPLEHCPAMFGERFDKNGVKLSSATDIPPYGALLFESQKNNGHSVFTVLYKVKWQPPEFTINIKTEQVTFQQPTISGTYAARMDLYVDDEDKRINLAYADADEESEKVPPAVIEGWFNAVYEPQSGAVVIPVTGVALDKTTITSLVVGGTEQLTPTITPANASNTAVRWLSLDLAIAKVTATGLVEGVAQGTTDIKVTTLAQNKEATCSVTVVSAVGDSLKGATGK